MFDIKCISFDDAVNGDWQRSSLKTKLNNCATIYRKSFDHKR